MTRSGSSSSAPASKAQAAGARGREAAQRVDDRVAVERPRHRVDGEVARPQVVLETGAPRAGSADRRRVRRAAHESSAGRRHDAQCRSVGVAKTAPPSPSASARANASGRRDGEVDVADAAAQELVAQAPPTSQPASPGPGGGERGPGDLVGRRRRGRRSGPRTASGRGGRRRDVAAHDARSHVAGDLVVDRAQQPGDVLGQDGARERAARRV